jgi:hypothetical protein
MVNTLVIGAAMLIVCIGAGLLLGALLHRRFHAAQIADIDGDITALRLKVKEVHDIGPLPPPGGALAPGPGAIGRK